MSDTRLLSRPPTQDRRLLCARFFPLAAAEINNISCYNNLLYCCCCCCTTTTLLLLVKLTFTACFTACFPLCHDLRGDKAPAGVEPALLLSLCTVPCCLLRCLPLAALLAACCAACCLLLRSPAWLPLSAACCSVPLSSGFCCGCTASGGTSASRCAHLLRRLRRCLAASLPRCLSGGAAARPRASKPRRPLLRPRCLSGGVAAASLCVGPTRSGGYYRNQSALRHRLASRHARPPWRLPPAAVLPLWRHYRRLASRHTRPFRRCCGGHAASGSAATAPPRIWTRAARVCACARARAQVHIHARVHVGLQARAHALPGHARPR